MEALHNLLAPPRLYETVFAQADIKFTGHFESCAITILNGAFSALSRSNNLPNQFVQNPNVTSAHPLLVSIPSGYTHLHLNVDLNPEFETCSSLPSHVFLAVSPNSTDITQLQAHIASETQDSFSSPLRNNIRVFSAPITKSDPNKWSLDMDISHYVTKSGVHNFTFFTQESDKEEKEEKEKLKNGNDNKEKNGNEDKEENGNKEKDLEERDHEEKDHEKKDHEDNDLGKKDLEDNDLEKKDLEDKNPKEKSPNKYRPLFAFSLWAEVPLLFARKFSLQEDKPPPLPLKVDIKSNRSPEKKGRGDHYTDDQDIMQRRLRQGLVVSETPIPVNDLARKFRFNTADGPEFHQDLIRYELAAPIFLQHCFVLLDTLLLLKALLRRLVKEKEKLASCVRQLLDVRFGTLIEQGGFYTQLEKQLNNLMLPFTKNMEFLITQVCDPKVLAKMTNSYILVSSESASGGSNASNTQKNSGHNSTTTATEAVVEPDSSHPSSYVVLELVQARKQFDAACRLYYAWLGRYLSNDKERPPLKFLAKRKAFELAKFDYLNALDLVSNNQHTNHFFESVFKFVNVPMDPKRPQRLDVSTFDDPAFSQTLLTQNHKAHLMILMRHNSGKYQFRQMIQAAQSDKELSKNLIEGQRKLSIVQFLGSRNSQADFSHFDGVLDPGNTPDPSSQTDPAHKSGILYVSGGQGKQGWHKEWVVLRDGQLTEYADWRMGKIIVLSPIELALASIKTFFHEKRNHCFEIITSKGQHHVFQALTDDDRKSWLKALYEAAQNVNHVRLRGSAMERPRSNRRLKMSSSSSDQSITHEIMLPLVEKSGRSLPVSPLAQEDNILSIVRARPNANNNVCADCGLTDSVEWISLNLLVCFCVQCASCHRSLGSHISVVRSLRLDKFEGELHLLLRYISNARANQVLEATSLLRKPKGSVTDEQRMKFIQDKYQKKLFRVPNSRKMLNSSLVSSIQLNKVGNMIKCILGGASLELRVTILDLMSENQVLVSLFDYSLRKYVESDHEGSRRRYFVVSELMILNGCNVANVLLGSSPEIKLTAEAKTYWEKRKAKLGIDNAVPEKAEA